MSDPINKPGAGGDTPPAAVPAAAAAAAKSENPLFDSLFASAPAADKEENIDPQPVIGRSLTTVIAEENTPADKKEATKADDKKTEGKPADKKDEPAKAAPVKLTRRMGKQEAPAPVTPVVEVTKPKDEKKSDESATVADADFEKTLEPEEAEQVALLRYAAGKKEYGEKYKGAPEKAIAFIKAHADFIAKKKAEDPDYEFTDANPEYAAWLKANKPAVFLSPTEIRRVEKDQLRDELRTENEQARTEERNESARRDLVPKIKKQADGFFHEATTAAMPADMATVFKEKGADEAKKLFPDEYEILEETVNATTVSVETFLGLVGGVTKFNPQNAMHAKLDQFISFQCDDFLKNGANELVQNGKQFVTRAAWNVMPAAEKAKHWTFSDSQVVALIREATKSAVGTKIKAFHEKQAARGWKRGAAAEESQAGKEAVKKEDAAPAAKVKPGPTGGGGDDKAKSENAVLSVLGMAG